MKRIFFGLLLIVGLGSCSVNKQAQQIKALEKCDYRLLDATNISVAGTDIQKLIKGNNIDLTGLPSLALGYLRKDIPLRANLNLEISNPSNTLAAINNFDYIILINKQEIANGTVDQRVSIEAGQTTRVPVQLNTNIYKFLVDGTVMSDITEFLKANSSGTEKKGMVTLKIRPSIMVGGGLVKYPGYITIDKEVSSKILL
ncbi:LEA type 2 family protein [Pedobacter namyangjuensis]|uniref:LEA type 2 family protein n=1 Tax=Pedobacter namyangjuensis TaxID=600626 RepID=UPI000DE2730B|nr:LEA type 2 family protein [Pedobacter namyangjuensis]